MTPPPQSRNAAMMSFRRLYLLLLMLVSSFVTSASLHAAEMAGPVTIECSGYVHSDGDFDETQGDADKGVPHHHAGCQGGISALPSRELVPDIYQLLHAPVPAARVAALGRWISGPDLRPPIA